MGRWEPNARARLEKAALDLYNERGFEQTTVAEIAKRAGLVERTFFRHFKDKREVLFGGSAMLRDYLVNNVVDAPAACAPIDALAFAFEAVSGFFQDRREFVQQRQHVIDANIELQERELIKLSSLASALAVALRQRGVSDPAMSLAAEAGVAVFKIAFNRWIGDAVQVDLSMIIRESFDDLKSVVAGR